MINKSALLLLLFKYSHKKSSTRLFLNIILSTPFNLAFSSQSFEEDFTNSTLYTFFAPALANIIPIVPVHAYKSKTV